MLWTENTCSASESQSARGLSRQWWCSAWETTHPHRLMLQPFQLTSCFMLGREHHTVRHKAELLGVRGHRFCGTTQRFYVPTARRLQRAAALFGLLHVVCIKLWHGAYLDSHIFTTGFAVTSQHMEIVCPSAWFLFYSPQGLLRGPLLPTGPNTFYAG